MKYYAGIGSRETPRDVLDQMKALAFDIASKESFILRSGGARGADTAFQSGAEATKTDDVAEIFRWQDAVEDYPSRVMAQQVINLLNSENGESLPALSAMRPRVAGLLARNMMIMAGKNVSLNVAFVVAWTPNGEMTGGTRYALKFAEMFGIPVYNYGVMTDGEIRRCIREVHGVDVNAEA